MDFVLTLAVLYGWQCSVRVGRDEELLVRGWGRWLCLRGPGRRLAHPWPSAVSILTRIDAAPEGQAFSPPRFEEALASARHATRWLALWCNLYLVLLVLIAPLSIALLTEEAALARVLPGALLVHAGGLVLLERAERRLRGAPGAERWERLAICALYPPALLRAPQDLLREELKGFHPLAACAVLLPPAEFQERVRQTLARLRSPRHGPAGSDAARAAILRIARAQGLSEAELARPRPRRDPNAASYCESCLCDYRRASVVCPDCAIPTLAYPEVHT